MPLKLEVYIYLLKTIYCNDEQPHASRRKAGTVKLIT